MPSRMGYKVRTRKHKVIRRKKGVRLDLVLIFMIIVLVSIIPTMLLMDKGKSEPDSGIVSDKGMYIPHEFLKLVKQKSKDRNIAFSKLLAYSVYVAREDGIEFGDKLIDKAVRRAKAGESMGEEQLKLLSIYEKVYDDLKVSPIPKREETHLWDDKNKSWYTAYSREYTYTSSDDFGNGRTYKGDRTHEGNDLISDLGTPIVSITDGVITRIGWNELGGYRIGITSNKGTYFYYAHMDRYVNGLEKGMKVSAGDMIGYVGDTGYGPEGTRGKMIPHLHVQIGYTDNNSKGYIWYNPYDIIKFLDSYRVVLVEKKK